MRFGAKCDTSTAMLVVEDEPFPRAALVKGLQEEGYIVDAAGDGEEAVYQAAQTDYDLLLLDLNLPRLNGIAVCAQLRNLGSRAKVLMVTARDGVHDKIAGLDAARATVCCNGTRRPCASAGSVSQASSEGQVRGSECI